MPKHNLRLAFSLRTLLIGFTALALWLGYEFNWIHQRHAFLAQQFEHFLTAAPGQSQSERREWLTEWWRPKAAMSQPAPWALRIFGENGVVRLPIVVGESDVTMRTWGNEGVELPVDWPEISASQADYRRAKRLFPEAHIRPVRLEEWSFKYRGGKMSEWLRPVVIREHANETTVRLECDSTVIEGSYFSAQIYVVGPPDSTVLVPYRTCDGTATTPQGNLVEPADTLIFEPRPTAFPSHLIFNVGRLTDEQRAAGGATFRIRLGTVVGATAEVTEKTIMIVVSKK